jgi:hypothetical protein
MLMSLVQSAIAEDRITFDELPSLEFLDYLGELVETDGELVGPGDFDDGAITDTAPETVERDPWISRDQQEGIYRD